MMSLEEIVQHANTLASLAERAIELRIDARNYRALGKTALADLLDQETAEWEGRARKALNPARTEVVMTLQADGPAIHRELLNLKRRRVGGLGLA